MTDNNFQDTINEILEKYQLGIQDLVWLTAVEARDYLKIGKTSFHERQNQGLILPFYEGTKPTYLKAQLAEYKLSLLNK